MSTDHLQPCSESDRVAISTRIGWGFGGIADNFMTNTFFYLAMIIYTTAFYMPAALAGMAMCIPRLFDAITDPLIGNFSDNFRSRWGRRRPLMLVGVIGCALLLPTLWYPPMLETVVNPWYSNVPFWFMAVVGSVYFFFFTLFAVPYTALGYELTPNYDERTRVLAWRMYLGLFASMTVPSLYWFCRADIFGDGVEGEITGVRVVSVIVSVVILTAGLIPVLMTREREDVERQKTISLVVAVRDTMTNRPFLILFIAYMAVIMGLFTAGTVGQFAIIYYVFQNAVSVDIAKDHASSLGLVVGVLGALTSYLSMFLVGRISMLTSKRHGMILGLTLLFSGTVGIWFFYSPDAAINVWGHGLMRNWGVNEAWAAALVPGVLLVTFMASLGGQGCWLMTDSMTADLCDEDELQTGIRREGMYSAVMGFARKLAFAFTILCGGFMLDWVGFDPAMAEAAGGVAPEVSQRMLIVLMISQDAGLAIAISVFMFYPISRARSEATRAELDRRHKDRSGKE